LIAVLTSDDSQSSLVLQIIYQLFPWSQRRALSTKEPALCWIIFLVAVSLPHLHQMTGGKGTGADSVSQEPASILQMIPHHMVLKFLRCCASGILSSRANFI
jgi:hypothetical protein